MGMASGSEGTKDTEEGNAVEPVDEEDRQDHELVAILEKEHQLWKGERFASKRQEIDAQLREVRKRIRARLPPTQQAHKAKLRLNDLQRKQKQHQDAAEQATAALAAAQEADPQAKEQLEHTKRQVAEQLEEWERLRPAEEPTAKPKATGDGSGEQQLVQRLDGDDEEDTVVASSVSLPWLSTSSASACT